MSSRPTESEMSIGQPRSATQCILPDSKVKALAREWLAEDCASFDFGGMVVGNKTAKAQLLCKSPGVLAGVPFFDAVFRELGCIVTWHYHEGDSFVNDEHNKFQRVKIATVCGPIKNILLGERPALNVLSRSSGVATQCKKYIARAKEKGWKGRIAGTRKTTPGFRLVEKYSLVVGGADTHRYDLASMVMLKDNHIWSTGSIENSVKKVLSLASFTTKVEVECQNIDEGLEAAAAGAHVVMFDNQMPEELKRSAKRLKEIYPQVIIECSGGVDEQNIEEYFGDDIDVISTSKLVQGYPCVDFSLKILKDSISD
uniref:nicotinate-nucleotide pyrophosphorylase [carboxylating]-like n=1 Tax=Styela clava TaxID=7725 RepID=UPI00193ABD6F|nr:nicotinate-nucleotide pyrophosphorylase [carboxylating]-like [Styela clava]